MGDDTGISPYLEAFTRLATPFAERYAYGAGQASQKALLEERLRISRLTGNGPVDTGLAGQSPDGMLGLLTGATIDRATGKVSRSYLPLIMLAVIGAIVIWIWRR